MARKIWIECECCGGEGYTSHDCGEDSCCCLEPEDNVQCDACGGNGGFYREMPDDFPSRELLHG
jgi:hypothetical protein